MSDRGRKLSEVTGRVGQLSVSYRRTSSALSTVVNRCLENLERSKRVPISTPWIESSENVHALWEFSRDCFRVTRAGLPLMELWLAMRNGSRTTIGDVLRVVRQISAPETFRTETAWKRTTRTVSWNPVKAIPSWVHESWWIDQRGYLVPTGRQKVLEAEYAQIRLSSTEKRNGFHPSSR